jgi:hypothetical protein
VISYLKARFDRIGGSDCADVAARQRNEAEGRDTRGEQRRTNDR